MAVVNLARAKRVVASAIAVAPSHFTVYRPIYSTNALNEQILERTDVVQDITCLFDNTNVPIINMFVVDGGISPEQSSTRLYILWEPDVDVRENDFIKLKEEYYRFSNVENILEVDVLILVELELREADINGK